MGCCARGLPLWGLPVEPDGAKVILALAGVIGKTTPVAGVAFRQIKHIGASQADAESDDAGRLLGVHAATIAPQQHNQNKPN